MIDINKEAEEYESFKLKQNGIISNRNGGAWAQGFIAGYNSKATQAKILQAQIDVLEEINSKCFGGSNTCKFKIQTLQKQLTKLENEKNININSNSYSIN